MEAVPYLTTGDLAKKHGIPEWKVRRVFERKLHPEPQRLGHNRVIASAEVPLVEQALVRAGYIQAPKTKLELLREKIRQLNLQPSNSN